MTDVDDHATTGTPPDSATEATAIAEFETVDWDAIEPSRRSLRARTLVFLVGVAVLSAGVLYDYFEMPPKQPLFEGIGPTTTLFGQRLLPLYWDVRGIEWLFLASILAFACFAVVPLAKQPRLTRFYWERLRRDRFATGSLFFLAAVFVLGVVGPVLYPPTIDTAVQSQPPAFTSTPINYYVSDCVGSAAGERCHGTLRYPLGTNALGKPLTALTISGMRVVVELAFVTSLFIVPLATAVGTVAGYFRGRVDTVLMGYVDAQQTVPAFVAYLLLAFWGRSLFLFVLVFGLFSWGGIARLVRSETLQRREDQFVLAAKNAGASDWYVIREHILPNVSNTVVTAMTRMIPLLILLHTAVAYMGMNRIMNESWGETIANGFNGLQAAFPQVWWTPVVPTVFLALTVMAFGALGDGLRDALDPRQA
ncbi:ABC transporter permease [Halorubellus sp. JP-L1]|uniref:ABC transporter permease n=1 Tax=Halorubellus sp. JP-L1 TaxID=2715753 RepID=UPI001408A788|nr:ABC transporter permease [Halorubellus sp. JP-L1]NHN40368.1 ABC transporter permease [Halorubellus sp. JP-L1]